MKKSNLLSMLRNERGVLSLPLLILFLAITFMGFGTWGLMRRWRHLMETQLRLDQCVGQTALDLKHTLKRIETTNHVIQGLRAAAALTILEGASAAVTTAAEAVAAEQDLETYRWRFRQAQWLALRGCDSKADLPVPLPSMELTRLPPDALGPQTLNWTTGASKKLKIELGHPPRGAAAWVKPDEDEKEGTHAITELLGENNWKTSWTSPGPISTGRLWAIFN